MLKTLLFLIVTLNFALAQAPSYVKMSVSALNIENNDYIAVTLDNEKDWHTYWKNPGDAGLPIKLRFFQNTTEVFPQELEWPMPKRYIEQGNILAYGYSDSNTFFFKLSPKLKKQLLSRSLQVKGQWLVCKDICIPGEDEINISSFTIPLNSSDSSELIKRFKKLPTETKKPKNLELTFVKGKEENTISLHYSFQNIDSDKIKLKANLLTPFLAPPLDFKREELVYDEETKSLFGRMIISWDGEYEEPAWPLPADGIFQKEISARFLLQYDKQSLVFEHKLKSFALDGYEQYDSFIKKRSLKAPKPLPSQKIWYYILFAFLGGLILNLMPCVLPVISLKLFGLISHSSEKGSKILKHNLFYTLGVWMSFMLLALAVYLLKTSGQQIGWGFQLQSPEFVFAMLFVIFVMALNMLGLFEWRVPFGNKLGGIKVENSYFGDFFNGVLATILSTPCSAPFLGVALTFAFTTSTANIFIIFTSVALGLSFPFIITGLFPKTISFLPRPGAWMEKLKYFLGFSLILTFAWLYDVLSNLIDFQSFGIFFHTFFACSFFFFFLRKNISKNKIVSLIFILLPIILLIQMQRQNAFAIQQIQSHTISRGDLKWTPWSQEEMNKSVDLGQWTFMDFTATWCLTCKVNKKLVLDTNDFGELVTQKKLRLLVGDWTKRDEKITQFLREYNVVGVPAYFLQSPDGKVIHLGETISIAKIKGHL